MLYSITETQSGKQYTADRSVLTVSFVNEISTQLLDNKNVTGVTVTRKDGETIIVRKVE